MLADESVLLSHCVSFRNSDTLMHSLFDEYELIVYSQALCIIVKWLPTHSLFPRTTFWSTCGDFLASWTNNSIIAFTIFIRPAWRCLDWQCFRESNSSSKQFITNECSSRIENDLLNGGVLVALNSGCFHASYSTHDSCIYYHMPYYGDFQDIADCRLLVVSKLFLQYQCFLGQNSMSGAYECVYLAMAYRIL